MFSWVWKLVMWCVLWRTFLCCVCVCVCVSVCLSLWARAHVCVCVGFSERLLHQLEGTNERFEVKLMMMDLISRLVGVHQVSQSSLRNQTPAYILCIPPTPPYACPVHAHTWGGGVNWKSCKLQEERNHLMKKISRKFAPLVCLKVDCGEYEKLANLTDAL